MDNFQFSHAPHNKSKNARLAEARGERTWTNFTLKLLIEEVIRLNEKDVTEASLRAVRSVAKRLKASEVARWKDAVPSKDELAEDIEIRTRRKYAI